jgi:O-antigen biosynthesis protein WbqP
MYRSFVKRALDILLSALGTLLLSPLFLLISCAVKAEDGGPVFFTQKRIGIHKSTFNILKFRTMRTDTPHDMPTHLLSDPDRWITRVGRVLRRTSLDELPQILQILSGKMSIVGPRPALWNQYDLIAERDKYGANDVMPGLTGWAQVNGRDALEIEEKARYDGEYAEKLSFGLDLKIFVMTVINVLRHSDVVEGGTGTLKGAGK